MSSVSFRYGVTLCFNVTSSQFCNANILCRQREILKEMWLPANLLIHRLGVYNLKKNVLNIMFVHSQNQKAVGEFNCVCEFDFYWHCCPKSCVCSFCLNWLCCCTTWIFAVPITS